jgi:hypothetical protein
MTSEAATNGALIPPWLDDADYIFVEKACSGSLGQFEAGRELSQSNVAKVIPTGGGKPLFFKKSCVAALQIKSPRNPDSKWRVTQRSFVNEHRFLGDMATLDALRQKGKSGRSVDAEELTTAMKEYISRKQ